MLFTCYSLLFFYGDFHTRLRGVSALFRGAGIRLSGEGRETSINGHGFGGALHFDHQESVWYASGIAIRLADHFAHWSDFFATDADGQV